MRFSFLAGDMNFTRYGGKWISTRRNNGEFDYFYVVELLNWRETVGEREAPPETYNVSLSVVSPHEAKDKLGAAMECCGITEEMLATATEKGYRDMALVEALHSIRGTYARLEQGWKQLARLNEGSAQEAR